MHQATTLNPLPPPPTNTHHHPTSHIPKTFTFLLHNQINHQFCSMLHIDDINGDLHRNPKKPNHNFCINDHMDLLIEVLQRLDGRSLAAAACVCRQWCSVVRNDSLWEHLCFRHVSPPPSVGVRSVVLALGGYRRLYMVCVRPVATQLKGRRTAAVRGGAGAAEPEVVRRVWNRHEVELSLSLFCVEYYERLLGGGGGGAAVAGGGGGSPATSLKFLCKAVNVSI